MHAGLGEFSSMLRPQGGCRYTSMQRKSTSFLQAITGTAPVATGSAHADCCTIWSGIRAGKRLETTVLLQYRAMLFCIQTAQGLHLDVCEAGYLSALQLPAATCQPFLLQHLIQACCPLRLLKVICMQLHFSQTGCQL